MYSLNEFTMTKRGEIRRSTKKIRRIWS